MIWQTRVGDRLEVPAVGGLAEMFFGGGACAVVDTLIPVLLHVRTRQGKLLALVPNAAQVAFAKKRGRRNILLKARQLGMTTYIAARFFLGTMLREGTVSLQVAHSLESAQQIFRIVHRFYESLHPEIQRLYPLERANVREIAFLGMDSRYRVDTAGNENAGRGLTVNNLHCSEVALWPGRAEDTLGSLLASVPVDGVVEMESTPAGVGGMFHREWMLSVSGDSGFVPHFFPWWLEESYRRAVPGGGLGGLSEGEGMLRERYGLSDEQLQFRREMRAQFRDLAVQEFAEDANACFLASSRSVFDVVAIDARLGTVGEPAAVRGNGAEREFFAPEKDRDYVVAADVGEGVAGGDFSVAQVLDCKSGLQCLEYAGRIPIERFARDLVRLGRRYNNAVLAVERNNHGHAVLYALRHRHEYERIYAHRVGEGDLALGFPTTSVTKPQVAGALMAMLADGPEVFQSRWLLAEMRGFRYDESGAMGAPSGEHDDLVMAFGIGLVVRGMVRSPFLGSMGVGSGA